MASSQPELKFVSISSPGRAAKPGDDHALRSHVRKMVAFHKSTYPRPVQVKFMPVASPSTGIRSNRKRRTAPATAGSNSTRQPRRAPGRKPVREEVIQLAPVVECSPPATVPSKRPVGNRRHSLEKSAPVFIHPFATLAATHVDLPIRRLDSLFKSEAFRHAAEPLFDTTHVDSRMNMNTAFPNCMTNRAFAHALVYSIVQAFNLGKPTVEQLRLRGQTISALHASLSSSSRIPTSPLIGTVMILRGTAYKWEDSATHEVHVQGLDRLLRSSESQLTPRARSALFWQDLFAPIFVSVPTKSNNHGLGRVFGQRCQKPLRPGLPSGFVRHRDVIPPSLIDCVGDIIRLQEAVAEWGQEPRHGKHVSLDPMQADLEARLAAPISLEAALGAVANAVRLALFILTYTAYMDTWDFALLPGRLAEQLVTLLDATALEDVISGSSSSRALWKGRDDLLLWLLFVGATAAREDGGVVEGLGSRYKRALSRYQSKISTDWVSAASNCQDHGVHSAALTNALHDFLYAVGSVERRHGIAGWSSMEISVSSTRFQATRGV